MDSSHPVTSIAEFKERITRNAGTIAPIIGVVIAIVALAIALWPKEAKPVEDKKPVRRVTERIIERPVFMERKRKPKAVKEEETEAEEEEEEKEEEAEEEEKQTNGEEKD